MAETWPLEGVALEYQGRQAHGLGLGRILLALTLLSTAGRAAQDAPAAQPSLGDQIAEQVQTVAVLRRGAPSTDDPQQARRLLAALYDLIELEIEASSWERCDEHLTESREVARLLDDENQQAWIEDLAAQALQSRGDFAGAIGVLDRALESLSAAASMRPALFVQRADLAMKQQDPDGALRYLNGAELSLLGSPENEHVRADLYGLRSDAYLMVGLPDQAADAIEVEWALAKSLDDDAQQAAALHRANFHYAIEDYAAVEQDVQPILNAESPQVDLRAQAVVRSGLARAWLSLERREFQEARTSLLNLLQTKGLGPADAFHIERLLVRAALGSGDWATAQDGLEQARQRLVELEEHSPRLRQRTECASYAAALALGRGSAEDRSRLAVLRDELARAIARELDDVRSIPPRPGGVGPLYFDAPQTSLSELIRLEIALEAGDGGCVRAFEHVLRTQNVGSMTRRVGAPSVDLATLRAELLSGGWGLLVYLPAMDRSHLFAVDARSIEHYSLAPSRDIYVACDRFVKVIAASPHELRGGAARAERARDVSEAGRSLAELLLPIGVRARLKDWTDVYIVGSEMLRNVRFEALPMDTGHLLGVEKALAYLPSLPIGVWLARRAREQPSEPTPFDVVLFTSPNSSERVRDLLRGLSPIEIDADVERRLERPFGPARTLWLRREDAAAARLASHDVDHAKLLTFLTHGVFDRVRERPAGLVITPGAADEGILWSEDIEKLTVPPVVALFACGSDQGPRRMGDDASTHLGGAFFLARASSVVLSRGEVAYESTLSLAEAFLDASARGQSVAEALRLARARVVANEDWSDPYYCASASVFGLGDRVLFRAGAVDSQDHEPRSLQKPGGSSLGWIIAAGLGIAIVVGCARRITRSKAG